MSALALSLLMTLNPPTAEVTTNTAEAGEGGPADGRGIDQGDFRLGLNGGLFNFTVVNTKDEVMGVDTRFSNRTFGFGFAGPSAATGVMPRASMQLPPERSAPNSPIVSVINHTFIMFFVLDQGRPQP